MNENALLESMRGLFAGADPSVITGSGPDDCAHIETGGRRLSLSVDAFAENSHFLADTPPRDVARKALAASLSDLAASGCRARWALVCLCMRKGLAPDWADEFAAGLAATAREYGVSIIGGDTISSPHGTFVSVTVAGEPLAGGPLLRSGGKPGDVLVVTGELGGSIKGKHLRPVARLREVRLLMDFCGRPGSDAGFPSAAMDISDGLALDLSRLCHESGVGAVVDGPMVPVSEAARQLAAESGQSPLHHALADGEDFELLIAMPPRTWRKFRDYLASPEGVAAAAGTAAFSEIGALAGGGALLLRDAGGALRPLAPEGYEHQW